MNDLYIGLISGTSMDGIDAALVRFGDHCIDILGTHEHEYPTPLREQLLRVRSDESLRTIDDTGSLHGQVGETAPTS